LNKRNWIITIFVLVMITALLLPVSACTKEEAVTSGTIKFNYTMPPGSAVAGGFEWWADEFEKQTDGRWKVETYALSSLVPDAGALDAVKGGVCEIIMSSTGSHATDFPLAAVTGLPTLSFHKKGVTKEEYMASFKALVELYKLKEVAEEFKDYHIVTALEADPGYLVTKNKEVLMPEDLAGLKVGGGSGVMADMMTAYKAAGVFQIPPESYVNMDKGVTDAAFMTYAQIGPYKMYEIADYIFKQVFSGGTMLVLASPKWYNSLSKADKKIFDDTWKQAEEKAADSMTETTKKMETPIVSSGIKINIPTAEQTAAWEAACAKYAFPTWAKQAQDLGYSKDVTDKVLKKWQDLVKELATQK
jgi:TRAP-type C4-dicarboxylate transport system substrate-binding protein